MKSSIIIWFISNYCQVFQFQELEGSVDFGEATLALSGSRRR